jgi:hypothetical protein
LRNFLFGGEKFRVPGEHGISSKLMDSLDPSLLPLRRTSMNSAILTFPVLSEFSPGRYDGDGLRRQCGLTDDVSAHDR